MTFHRPGARRTRRRSLRGGSWLLAIAATLLASPATAEPTIPKIDTGGAEDGTETGDDLRGYARPYFGWGGPALSEPENHPSWYRYGAGASSGVNLSGVSLGLDFVFFTGSRFISVDSLENPTVERDARRQAFRFAGDFGYEFDLGWMLVQPHLLGGVEWRRTSVGDRSRVTQLPYWAPSIAALVPLRKDVFMVGMDARSNMLLVDGAVEAQLSTFLVFGSVF